MARKSYFGISGNVGGAGTAVLGAGSEPEAGGVGIAGGAGRLSTLGSSEGAGRFIISMALD